MILITGATGNNGSELVKLLAGKGVALRAMVRSKESAGALAALPSVTVVEGNFDRPTTIERALDGVEKAFLLTNSTERAEARQSSFVQCAGKAGVRHIVKLSQFAADEASPVRFLRYHAAIERQIVESKMAHTFLRPNLFMQGLLGFAKSIKEQGKLFAAAGDAKISVVDVRDNAAAAAAALTEPGHEGKTYTLTGPAALSHGEMAAALSKATGQSIEFADVTPDAMRDALLDMGMPPWQADGLIEDYAHYRRGEAAVVSDGVEQATGRAPRGFDAFARDHAPAFA